ncbi:hypothetical protein FF38_11115 [Lucilia cuprina]|uniref:Uncharacterized protein n=1 Tax=Lucilia cuprina TaxID=7375 RepID=A0A0L0CR95_LUCCU|nr:hypothetical protein FF38_11115 [Lucilia cuprina]
MPAHLEFLVNETYNWFSRSYIRQQSYKHIFEAINDEKMLNKRFQSQNVDPTKLLNDMEVSINYLKQFVLEPDTEIDIFTSEFESYISYNLYLGFSFESTLKELNNEIGTETETSIRHDCAARKF